MANTYTQLYTQIVFAVKGRENLIREEKRQEIEKFMCGVINNRKSKVLAIYCNPDHVHILISFNPTISLSDLTRDVKATSSAFINEKKWLRGTFRWQDGFGAFSYSKSQIDQVAKYILDQAEHHKRKSFREEYLNLLKKNDIYYEEKYLFEWYDVSHQRYDSSEYTFQP
jgi:REP element-mobilizing transposase RayT